ncbi:MAG TPA: non-ribosomal peptide synthetase, partial [Rhizomicrobium sp.]|nr:non-ribosomal peptide synthetase [Rhizomicrobium sp.]
LLRPFLEQKDLPDLSRLRHVMCGGEVFSPKLAALFLERLNAEVCNSYGPTECSIGVTRWPCRRDETRDSIPIGYAIDNTELYILDAELRPVAKNVTGELYIGGICLARGYLNRPELTAERFIANPFRPGERMYRTGDLCRFLDDDSIDFLGRADDQVKIRGVRIELGEVEKAIAAHEGVDVAAVVIDGAADSASLVAYVVPAEGAALTDRDLRGFLRKKLPLAMIPSEFYFVQSLPVSANGKLDRKALKIARQMPEAPAEAPRDEIEERVKAIWCDLLERDDFGVRDDFFDCGGDSFAAMQLYLRIEEEFGLSDTLDALDVLTIENLANVLREKPAAGETKASAQEGRRIGGVLLRLASVDDIKGIWRVCARAFPPYANASLDDFRALCDHRWLKNPTRSDDDPFGWVLEADDGRIVGFHGLAPTRLKVGTHTIDAIAPTTWAADPGFARAGLALLSTYLDWGANRFLLNTTANSITSAMHESGNRGMTKIPLADFDRRFLWLLDAKPLVRWRLGETDGSGLLRKAASSRFVTSLASALAPFALGIVGGAGAAWRASFKRNRINFACKPLAVEPVARFGAEFDELWNRLKNHYDVTTERSAEMLNWRHIDTPRLLGRSYALAVRENGKLLGYVALREPSTTAPGHFIVTDLFYDPSRTDAMQNLMNAAFEFAAAHGASVFEVFGFHPSLNHELASQHPYVLRRAQLERLGRDRSLRNIAAALFGRDDTSSSTYWYRAPSAELREICATGSWWPSGIDGDLNL